WPFTHSGPGRMVKGWRLEAGGWRLEAGGWRLESVRANANPQPSFFVQPSSLQRFCRPLTCTGNRRTLIMSNRQSTKERGMGQWYQFLIDWLTQHPQWLGLILLVAACVECLAVVGLLV